MSDKMGIAAKFNGPKDNPTASNPIVVRKYDVSARYSASTLVGSVIGAGQKAWVHAVPGQTWLTHPHAGGGRCGVGGNGVTANGDGYPVPGADEGCMWLRVGNGITYYFPRGADNMVAELREQGQLVVGPNDDDFGDNDGDISLIVEIRDA
jgi:hypothetical protein